MSFLTQAKLKEVLHYDPDTGLFVWIKKTSHASRIKFGQVAGTMKNGYVNITIYGTRHLAHRLACLYVNGSFPENCVDHENHVKDDNRWFNLREATHQDNMRNIALRGNNKSGINGVGWRDDLQKWHARIVNNKKSVHLGYFSNIKDAAEARKIAEHKYGYHINHGEAA